MEISDAKLNDIFEDLSNKHLLMYTTKKMRQLVKNVIGEMDIPSAKRALFVQKLQAYKFVDEINQLKYGSYIRWIPIHVEIDEIELNTGAIFAKVKYPIMELFCCAKTDSRTNCFN